MQTLFKKPEFHPEANKRSKSKETSHGTVMRQRTKESPAFWSAVMAKLSRRSPG